MAGESEFTFVNDWVFSMILFFLSPEYVITHIQLSLLAFLRKSKSFSNFWGFLNPQPVPDSIRHCWCSQRNLINSNNVLAQLGILCFGNKPFDKKDDIFFDLTTPGDLIALIFTQLLPLRGVAWRTESNQKAFSRNPLSTSRKISRLKNLKVKVSLYWLTDLFWKGRFSHESVLCKCYDIWKGVTECENLVVNLTSSVLCVTQPSALAWQSWPAPEEHSGLRNSKA